MSDRHSGGRLLCPKKGVKRMPAESVRPSLINNICNIFLTIRTGVRVVKDEEDPAGNQECSSKNYDGTRKA